MKARIRGDKTTKSFAGPLDMETENSSGTFKAITASKNNPQEADLDGKAQDRDLVAEICDLRQRLYLSKFGWNDLHPVTITSSFTQDFRVTML